MQLVLLVTSLVVPSALSFTCMGDQLRRSTKLDAVGIFYSTTTGNTENVAGYIQEAAGQDEIYDIGDVSAETFKTYDGLLLRCRNFF